MIPSMSDSAIASAGSPETVLAESAAFLVSKVGAHVARAYKERLTPVGLEPRHVALLRYVSAAEGRSQQALAELLEIAPSRIVALLDDLEQRGLVERRRNPSDRRAHALYLTVRGRALLEQALGISRVFESQLCANLDAAERDQLIALLRRLAAEEGIPLGVHPGLADPRAAAPGC